MPATEFTVDTQLNLQSDIEGHRAGLILYGMNYAWIGLDKHQGQMRIVLVTCLDAAKGSAEQIEEKITLTSETVHLRLVMKKSGFSQFYFSQDAIAFTPVGNPMSATAGRWVGAKIGLFNSRSDSYRPTLDIKNYADFSHFSISHKDK